MFGDGVDSNANIALSAALRTTVTNYLDVLRPYAAFCSQSIIIFIGFDLYRHKKNYISRRTLSQCLLQCKKLNCNN